MGVASPALRELLRLHGADGIVSSRWWHVLDCGVSIDVRSIMDKVHCRTSVALIRLDIAVTSP